MNALMAYVKKRVAFEQDKEAQAKTACEEELNNFENLAVNNFPEDGKISDNK